MTPTIPRWWTATGKALWALALAGVLVSLWAVRYLAPVEEQMGVVQKIFYVHVPSAMATLIGFGVTFAASIAYLATKQWYWDAIAASACRWISSASASHSASRQRAQSAPEID